jgi:D-lactate dehydrogenase (cytochrome)
MAARMRFNPSAMRGLRRTPLIGRQQHRFNSTGAGPINQNQFWTTNKVLLLSAFTGALAYTYGTWDARSTYKTDGVNASQAPVYAKKTEWERVIITAMCVTGRMLM